MKQFCRVYMKEGSNKIVAVYTNNTGQAPLYDPLGAVGVESIDMILNEDDPTSLYINQRDLLEKLEIKRSKVTRKVGVTLPVVMREIRKKGLLRP